MHPELGIVLESGTIADVPPSLEALAQSVLVEAVRNARKHAKATQVEVSLSNSAGTFAMQPPGSA
jgi:signal transduction histidine kinase